jgi:N-acetylneuraminic acid mutarotase
MAIRTAIRIGLAIGVLFAFVQFLFFPERASLESGGSAPGAPTTSTAVFLPFVTNSLVCSSVLNWSERAPLPTARWSFGAATGTNGHVYAIGGYNNAVTPPELNANEMYDPVADKWTEETPLPTARSALGVVASTDGRIFTIGGESLVSPFPVYTIVEIYQPTTNAWTTGASLPEPRAEFGSALGADGNIYIFGGHSTHGAADGLVYQYNPMTNVWSSRANLLTARALNQAVTGSDGKIYVFGGISGSSPLNVVEQYDPVANTWVPRSPMPYAEYAGAAALGIDGRIYVMGGGNGTTTFNYVQVYDPTTDTWTTPTNANLPTARGGLAAAVANSAIFAIGGALSPAGVGALVNEELTISSPCGMP